MRKISLPGRTRCFYFAGTLRGYSLALKLVLAPALVIRVAGTTYASSDRAYTPLILSVRDAPVAFKGSDGHRRSVYELGITNFSKTEQRLLL